MDETSGSDDNLDEMAQKVKELCGPNVEIGESLTMHKSSEDVMDVEEVAPDAATVASQQNGVKLEPNITDDNNESKPIPIDDGGRKEVTTDAPVEPSKEEEEVKTPNSKAKRTVKIANRSVKPSPLTEVVPTSRMISLKSGGASIVTEKVASTPEKVTVVKDHVSQLPKRQETPDVTINVKPTGLILAHEKVLAAKSTHYKDFFKKMSKSRNKKIEIEYPVNELKPFIDQLYKPTLSFDEAKKSLPIAMELKFDKFVQECCDVMAKGVDAKNCLELKLLSMKMGNQDLGIVAESHILKNISNVLRTEEFLKIPIETIQELLQKKNLNFNDKQVALVIDAWLGYQNRKKDGDLFIKVKALELLRSGKGVETSIFDGKPDEFQLPVSDHGAPGWVYLQAFVTPKLATDALKKIPKMLSKFCETPKPVTQSVAPVVIKKENIKKEEIAPLLPGLGQKKRIRIIDSDNEDDTSGRPGKVPFKIPKKSYRDLDSPAESSWNPLGTRTPTKIIPIPDSHPKAKPKPYKKGSAFSPDAQDEAGSWNDPGFNDNVGLTPKKLGQIEPPCISPSHPHVHAVHAPQHVAQPVCCANPACANNYPQHMYMNRIMSACGDPTCRNPHCMPMYVNPHHGAAHGHGHGHIVPRPVHSIHEDDGVALPAHHGSHARDIQRIPRNAEMESVDKPNQAWDTSSIGSNDSGGRGSRGGNRGFGNRNNRNDNDSFSRNNGGDNGNRGGRGRGYQGGNRSQNSSWDNGFGAKKSQDDDWGSSSTGGKKGDDDDWSGGSSFGAKKTQGDTWNDSGFGGKKNDTWSGNNNSGGRSNDFGGRGNRGGFGREGGRGGGSFRGGNRDNNGNGRGFGGGRGRGERRTYGNNDNWGNNSGSSQAAATSVAPADEDWDAPAPASNNSRPAPVAATAPPVEDDWGDAAPAAPVAVNRPPAITATAPVAVDNEWGSAPVAVAPTATVSALPPKDDMDFESASSFDLPSITGFMVKPSATIKETGGQQNVPARIVDTVDGSTSANSASFNDVEQKPVLTPLPDPRLAPTPLPSPVISVPNPAPVAAVVAPAAQVDDDDWA